MFRKWCALLTVLCLLLPLAACGGNPHTDDIPSATVTTARPADTQEPLTPALAPTFGAMPQKTQDLAEVYRLSDSVVLFGFITPGMDAAATEVVCYDMAADAVLGELDLGERWVSLFPVEDGFAAADYNAKTYTVYDTACAERSKVTLAFGGAIGSVAQNGRRLLLSDLGTGQYALYDLSTHAVTPVDTIIGAAEYTCVGCYGEAFLLCSYSGGLFTVAPDGSAQRMTATAANLQAAGDTYAAGVVGDYVVFHSLTGGDVVMSPVRGGMESFCSAYGNGLLSSTGDLQALHYYDLSRRTVTDYAMVGEVADAALWGTSAVAAVRVDGQPLTFAYVDFATLTAEGLYASAYDKTVIDDLRPLPTVSGTAAEIQQTYGVTVIGDVDFFDLSVFGYTAEPAAAAQIADRTEKLKEVLAFFPEGIFKEIGAKTPVVVVLCQELSNAAGGINTVLDGYAVSYLSVTGNDAFFKNVGAHELAHAVERQMACGILDGWVSMQPAAVQAAYGNRNLTVEYTADDKGKTPVWFIDVYGRTEPIEDRATVFAAMYDAWAEGDISPLDYDGLKQKVAYWSRMLRDTYACCADATFAWDGLLE